MLSVAEEHLVERNPQATLALLGQEIGRRLRHHPWWHNGGMSRTRLSTTVDADLLESARKAAGKPDSALVDEALAALLARHRAAEVDASYAAYDTHPLDEPDAWGDLASFRRAVSAS
jgi:hypothetical protein